MTPERPGDRPWTGRRETVELGPTKPPRGASEASGARPPPIITADQAAELLTEVRGVRGEIREVKAEVARAEGRMLSNLTEVEKRGQVRVESRQVAEISAQLTLTERELETTQAKRTEESEAFASTKRLLARALTGAVAAALLALTAYLDRCSASRDVVEKVEVVASDTAEKAAESKTAELAAEHAQTKRLAAENSTRIDTMEKTLGTILEEVRALKQPPAAPKGKAHK
jgi:hypothetical protein